LHRTRLRLAQTQGGFQQGSLSGGIATQQTNYLTLKELPVQ
jgi:hypothetical protein